TRKGCGVGPWIGVALEVSLAVPGRCLELPLAGRSLLEREFLAGGGELDGLYVGRVPDVSAKDAADTVVRKPPGKLPGVAVLRAGAAEARQVALADGEGPLWGRRGRNVCHPPIAADRRQPDVEGTGLVCPGLERHPHRRFIEPVDTQVAAQS